MTSKAQELNNRKEGDRRQCPICCPKPKRIRMDQLWAWSLAHPGENPFRK